MLLLPHTNPLNQPRGALRPNLKKYSNPSFFLSGSDPTLVDRAKNRAPAVASGTIARQILRNSGVGTSLFLDGATSDLEWVSPTGEFGGNLTAVVHAICEITQWQELFAKRNGVGGNPTEFGINFNQTIPAFQAFHTTAGAFQIMNCAPGATNAVNGGFIPTVQVPFVVVVRRVLEAGGYTVQAFQDGAMRGSVTGLGAIDTGSTNCSLGMIPAGAGEVFGGGIYFCAVLPYALSAAHCAALSLNPYDLAETAADSVIGARAPSGPIGLPSWLYKL